MEEPSISELERRRLENIERNAKYLSEIGLSVPIDVKVASRSSSNSKKRSRPPPVIVADESVSLRRSSRVAALRPINYQEASVYDPRRTSALFSENNAINEEIETKPSTVLDIAVGVFRGVSSASTDNDNEKVTAPSSSSASSSSCSALDADISTLLSLYLGDRFPETGKACVMQVANRGVAPRFSKLPGLHEWRNALFLWVNVGGSGGYTNNFSERGRHMMWYGGSRLHGESRVVKRLIAATRDPSDKHNTNEKDASSDVNGAKDEVLLFIRVEGEEYTCCGRVRSVAIDLQASPIAVKWELMDYETLSTKEYFQEILRASKCVL